MRKSKAKFFYFSLKNRVRGGKMREDLKDYLDRKVSELPEKLRDEIKNQFTLFDRLKFRMQL